MRVHARAAIAPHRPRADSELASEPRNRAGFTRGSTMSAFVLLSTSRSPPSNLSVGHTHRPAARIAAGSFAIFLVMCANPCDDRNPLKRKRRQFFEDAALRLADSDIRLVSNTRVDGPPVVTMKASWAGRRVGFGLKAWRGDGHRPATPSCIDAISACRTSRAGPALDPKTRQRMRFSPSITSRAHRPRDHHTLSRPPARSRPTRTVRCRAASTPTPTAVGGMQQQHARRRCVRTDPQQNHASAAGRSTADSVAGCGALESGHLAARARSALMPAAARSRSPPHRRASPFLVGELLSSLRRDMAVA